MLHRRSEGGVLCLITPTTKVGGKKKQVLLKIEIEIGKRKRKRKEAPKTCFQLLALCWFANLYDLRFICEQNQIIACVTTFIRLLGWQKAQNNHKYTHPFAPNPTIIYKTLFCHSFSFGLNGLSKVPNFIWFSHCSTWFACTKSVGKKKKVTKHRVSEKKSKWLKMKLWWAITHIDKDPHLSRMIGTGIAGLIAVLWPASRIRNVALTRQLSGKVCGQGWLACLRKGYFSNSLAMGKWYTI